MRVIGVVDLLGGRAVHARRGIRHAYEPVSRIAGRPIETGNAGALALEYIDHFGITELYAADLDAIQGLGSQDRLVAMLAALGPPLWLDAGATSVDRAAHLMALGAAHVIVGLETLTSYDALKQVCSSIGGERVAFSLDLRAGRLISTEGLLSKAQPPHEVAVRAARAGVGALIVLDLAQVGTLGGLDFELITQVRQVIPGLTLLAGGGVRGPDDVMRLADVGCDG